MDHSKKITYLFSVDALRIIAILSVIAIHASIVVLQNLNHDLTVGFASFFINQIARFAVPLFFLISGFVLELNYREKLSYFSFFKKRASRVLVPFIFWSFIYIIYSEGLGFLNHLDLNLVYFILQGNASYHLYFIPILILFYLAFPFFHNFLGILKKPIAIFSIIFAQTYLLYVDYYIKNLSMNQNLRIALLSFSMFILGMVASHNKERILFFVRKNLLLVICLFIALLFFVPLHVFSLSRVHQTSKYIYNQYHPLNYFYTVVFAALFFYILEKTQFAKKTLIELSKLSFFVFFVHVLVQYLFWNSIVVPLMELTGKAILTTFWFTPLLFLSISTISFSIAFVIHKIPNLSKVTG